MSFFNKKNSAKENMDNIVFAPLDGTIKTLSSLNDGVFSAKMMGDGIAISIDNDAKIVDFFAPISGELVTVFPTGHAFGIRTKEGLEVLLHIGIDTVNLEGKGFKPVVKQGETVKMGDKLVVVDVDYVRKHAPSSDVIIIITSGQSVVPISPSKEIKAKEKILEINI